MDGKLEIRLLENNNVLVSLPNKIGYERIARACSASFAQMFGLAPERIEDLKTAVAEACINAIQHGNKGRSDARVVVRMNFRDDTFTVSVMDQGEGMPELPQFPDIVRIIEDQEPTSGLGVFLIEQLMDRVEFNQMTTEGHVVTMEIKLNDENG